MSPSGPASGLSGGGSAAKAAQVFRAMDNDNNGALDFSEMLQALKELGVLEGFQASEVTHFLQKEVKEADVDHNGLIDFQEFQTYFQKLARMQQNEARLQKLRAVRKSIPSGSEKNTVLRGSFRTYCQFGKGHSIGSGRSSNAPMDNLRMNARQFSRLTKDAGLLKPSGRLDPMTTDVIFAQCKIGGDRHINFKGFLEAISMIADSISANFEEITELLAELNSNSEPEEAPKSPRKLSVLMQTPRRPKTAQPEKPVRTSFRAQTIEDLNTSALDKEGGADAASADIQALLARARAEGASVAMKEWREEKRSMQLHIENLQAVIAQMQEDQEGGLQESEPKPIRNEDGNSVDGRSISSSLKSELETIKRDMRAELHKQLMDIERHQQAVKGSGDSPTDDMAALNKMRLQLVQLEDVVVRLSETQASFAAGTGSSVETAPAADLEEAIQALEERAVERQGRLEAALLQIANKVDLLEKSIQG